jgi:hypothetical protein
VSDPNYAYVGVFSSVNGSRPYQFRGQQTLSVVEMAVDDGLSFLVTASQDRLDVRKKTKLFYESDDCTGSPWAVKKPEASHWHSAAIAPPGRTVYLDEADAQGQLVRILSLLDEATGACVEDLSPFLNSTGNATELMIDDMVPAFPIVDLDADFNPPFHIVEQ